MGRQVSARRMLQFHASARHIASPCSLDLPSLAPHESHWDVSLEVSRTGMASQRAFVDGHRNIGVQKQRRKPGSSTQRKKPLRKKFAKLAWILPLKLAWIFRGREKRAEKYGTDFVTNFAPGSAKIRDRTRAAKSKIHGELPPHSSFCAC